MMRSVILIGMMGSGKTTIGRILARKLNRAFVDTDREIEYRAGQTINEIFASDGEAAFRKMETDLLLDLVDRSRPVVIACGGGIIVRAENLSLLRQIGPVIWLSMSAEHLVERLRYSRRQSRPLLQVANWPDVVRQLMLERESRYRQAADIALAIDGLSPGQVVAEILRHLRTIEGRR